MFVIVVFLLHWITGVLTQGIFDPSTFTQATCVGNNQWTQWFDSGNPSPTVGEFEITNHIQQLFSSLMCAAPIAIEVIILYIYLFLSSIIKKNIFIF